MNDCSLAGNVESAGQVRGLPEAQICRAAEKYLRGLEWHVASEIPFWERAIDIGAVRGDDVLVIEAKVSFTKRLRSQIEGAAFHADIAIALVATNPKSQNLEWARTRGIGVWLVTGEGAVTELVAAANLGHRTDHYRNLLRDKILSRGVSAESGGRPCLKGEGPAHDTERAIAAYRELHPNASWAEIFANVPNQYSSARSLQSAIYSNRQRRGLRARMKATRSRRVEAALASGAASSPAFG